MRIFTAPSKFELDERLVRELRRAADVEGAHRQLRARLADRLGGDDADRLAHVDRRAARQIATVAGGADAVRRFAGQHRADLHFLDAGGGDRRHVLLVDHPPGRNDRLAVGVGDRLGGGAAENARGERSDDRAGVDDRPHLDAVARAAIRRGDDRVLRDVDETTRQIAGVGRLQRRVGEALAGAVGRVEVLENRQALLEVGDDRALDDLARRLGHQAAHRRELAHLGRRTARAGIRHHVDRIHRQIAAVLVLADGRDARHHLLGELVGALRPGVDDLVVLLALGDQAVVVLLLVFLRERRGLGDARGLGVRHDHVVLAERNAGLERLAESERHDAVAEDHRLLLTAVAVDGVDHPRDFLLRHQLVDDVERDLGVIGQQLAEHQPARRGVEHLGLTLAVGVEDPGAALDLAVQRDRLGGERVLDLAHVGEGHALPRLAVAHLRGVVEPEHHVLARHDDRLAVGGVQDVVGRHHQHARLELRLERQRHVHRHLVAVEVGVEGGADERMQLDRLALDQHRLERLNAEAVQGGRAVEHHRMLADHLVEDVPDFRLLLLDQLLGLLDGRRQTLGVEPRVDERLEQLERHLLGQAALVQLELGTDDDHRAAGIVDALAEQVLAEPALLALQHVGERLQRPLVGAGDDAAAAAVVEQGVDRLLQHPLLVADDDVGRAQLHQPLQAIVAVDDAAVEIVEVGRGEATAVERHQRPQVRRNDRDFGQDHPLRLVAGMHERLDDLQPLGETLRLQLALRLGDLDLQILGDLGEVHALEDLADRLGADHRREAVLAVFVGSAQELVLGQELTVLERRQARIEHDVGFEIEDALEVLERHVEQQADARSAATSGTRCAPPARRARYGPCARAAPATASLRRRTSRR